MSLTRLSKWLVLDTGSASAAKNMAIDAQLLEGRSALPILHLYDWERSSATYGYFIDPASLLCLESAKQMLDLARRPTGGGLIFHTTDWAFSLVIPASHPAYSVNVLDNYAFVNTLVIDLIKHFAGLHAQPHLLQHEPEPAVPHARYFCMAKPTKYDVMIGGRKVGGGAQRRTRLGFLHQGTISLKLPDDSLLEKVLLPSVAVHEAMQQNTCGLLEGNPNQKELKEARRTLSQLFVQKLITART